MVSWWADGGVSGYDSVGMAPADDVYHLATNGNIHADAITRLQYALPQPSFRDRIDATARLNFSAGDLSSNPGKLLTATMFIAPAAVFPTTTTSPPTPSQVIAAATMVFRGSSTYSTTGNKTINIGGPRAAQLQANTKYWLTVVPTAVPVGSSPSASNDIPITPVAVNSISRGISIWTNRTPSKPTITAPATGQLYNAGVTVPFTYVSSDADQADPGLVEDADRAGVQMQIAPRATASNPTPEWTDVQFVNAVDTSLRDPGWFIEGLDIGTSPVGPGFLLYTSSASLDLGKNSPTSGHADIPAGDWQLRVRTFDYGTPYPTGLRPLASTTGDFDPTTYPAVNTSPWSDAITLSVLAQVPPPLLISPINNTAVSEGAPVTLSWQYRNTLPIAPVKSGVFLSAGLTRLFISIFPTTQALKQGMRFRLSTGQIVTLDRDHAVGAANLFFYSTVLSGDIHENDLFQAVDPIPQGHRKVQIRRSGETSWTVLRDENSASTTLLISDVIPTYALDPGRYEWQVQVTDAEGSVSNWSEIGSFWVVPAPASGAGRPLPGSTIDGATLGCGTHRAFIYRRGGLTRVGEIKGIVHTDWARVRDDISSAQIQVVNWDIDCGNLLAALQTWAYELVLFRSNGYSMERVWEGPITQLTYEVDKVTIDARDVMGYAYRRIIKQAMNDSVSGNTVTLRAAQIIQNVFAPDDPNVLGYLQLLSRTDDPTQYRNVPAYARTAFEEIDDMASNSGLDYTTVGRAILLWGTKHRIGTLPEFRDKDLGSPPIVSEYGMQMANRYAVSDGNGVWGEATRLDADGNDTTNGLVEMLSSSWASEAESDTGTYTAAGLAQKQQSFADFAERSISSRFPAPVIVRVPDNTTLNPDTVISIQQLVPGVAIPLRSTSTLRNVVQTQKLDSVRVVEESGTETISITLSPFTREDTSTMDGEV